MAKPSEIERTPRFEYDRLFQVKLLRILYQDPQFTAHVAPHLDPQHFDRQVFRWLARTIMNYMTRYGHGIPLGALTTEARRAYQTGALSRDKHRTELNALVSKLKRPVKEASYIREEVHRFMKAQAQRTAIVDALPALKRGDLAEVDALFQRAIAVVDDVNGGLGHRFITDRSKRMKRRLKYTKNGVPTGLKVDDHLRPGGLPPKQLGVVIAPPSGGKTGSLVHIGKSAILESPRKERVLHISLELSQEVMEDRYDASFSQVPLNQLEDRPKQVRSAIKAYGQQFGECLIIKEFPPATLTVPALRQYIRSLERIAFYPTIIIIDYADLLLPSKDYEDSYENAGNIYQELRKLAFELNVPIWTASQGNRGSVEKEIITIADLAESFKKAMVSDLMLALCQTQEEKLKKMARFFIAKNRNGVQEIQFNVRLDWARQSIKNL